MIEFPETARVEWDVIEKAASEEIRLRQRIERDTLVEREAEKLRIRHEAARIFQQELDGEQTPVLEMMTLDDYQAVAATHGPQDLIEGVLNDESVCLLLGPSRSGKSTLSLQVCYSLVSGEDWLGQKVQQIAGSVGIMSYDMPGGLMLDWMSGFPNVDKKKFSVVNAHKQGNPLGVPEFRKKIADTWRAMSTEVVVVDSFSASFFGHDQNDAASTQAHYRDLKRFALSEVGARTLLVIVHSTDNSPTRPRGSSVHIDVADSIIAVWPDPKTGKRNIDMVKYREARGQQQMSPVVVGAPDSVTHLVAVDTGEMSLKGLTISPRVASAGSALFPDDIPEPTEPPDTDSEDEDEEGL